MDETSEADFVCRTLARLPAVSPPPGLNGRLLTGFDARQGRTGLWARFCEVVWPGAPVWAPASAFAAALLMGVALGAVLPAMNDTSMEDGGAMRFSLDQPASFSLVPAGMEGDL